MDNVLALRPDKDTTVRLLSPDWEKGRLCFLKEYDEVPEWVLGFEDGCIYNTKGLTRIAPINPEVEDPAFIPGLDYVKGGGVDHFDLAQWLGIFSCLTAKSFDTVGAEGELRQHYFEGLTELFQNNDKILKDEIANSMIEGLLWSTYDHDTAASLCQLILKKRPPMKLGNFLGNTRFLRDPYQMARRGDLKIKSIALGPVDWTLCEECKTMIAGKGITRNLTANNSVAENLWDDEDGATIDVCVDCGSDKFEVRVLDTPAIAKHHDHTCESCSMNTLCSLYAKGLSCSEDYAEWMGEHKEFMERPDLDMSVRTNRDFKGYLEDTVEQAGEPAPYPMGHVSEDEEFEAGDDPLSLEEEPAIYEDDYDEY